MRKIFFILILCSLAACHPSPNIQKDALPPPVQPEQDWQQQVDSLLPLFGHRNWILVVDKAFPALTGNGAGIQVINANADIPGVMRYLQQAIERAPHIKAQAYMDKELDYIPIENDTLLTQYKKAVKDMFKNQPIATILHDSVFRMMTQNARQFQVLVIKTNTCIAYSSIFLQLDCKYWDAAREQALRAALKAAKSK